MNILLAEDNLVNRKLALKILEKLGFRANAVENGKDALKALKKTDYDLILMDIQMPEMDGMKATRKIRNPLSGAWNHDIPIIAMTAHAMKGDRELCIEAGMNDYVTKPIDPKALLDAINRSLAKSAQSETASADDLPVFDMKVLLDKVNGDEDLRGEIVRLFMRDAPGHMGTLKYAINAGNAARVAGEARSIKSVSMNMCAERMREAAYSMELAGEKGDLDQAKRLCEKLQTEFIRLKEMLENEYPVQK